MSGPGLEANVELTAHLGATLDALDSRVADMGAHIQALAGLVQAPVHWLVSQTVVLPAGGVGVVDLGGPDMGHMWQVSSVVVGGLDDQTVAAGQAALYVSSSDMQVGSAVAPSLADLRDLATRLPNVAFYSESQCPLRAGEHLFVRFSGGTAGQAYVAAARVLDVQEGVLPQVWAR